MWLPGGRLAPGLGGIDQAVSVIQGFQWDRVGRYLTSNVVLAAVQEASLRAQIDATNSIIDANSKMLDILRTQFFQPYNNNVRGTFNFLGNVTGSSFADLLLGLPDSGSSVDTCTNGRASEGQAVHAL